MFLFARITNYRKHSVCPQVSNLNSVGILRDESLAPPNRLESGTGAIIRAIIRLRKRMAICNRLSRILPE
jgi:hypothetical protein